MEVFNSFQEVMDNQCASVVSESVHNVAQGSYSGGNFEVYIWYQESEPYKGIRVRIEDPNGQIGQTAAVSPDGTVEFSDKLYRLDYKIGDTNPEHYPDYYKNTEDKPNTAEEQKLADAISSFLAKG